MPTQTIKSVQIARSVSSIPTGLKPGELKLRQSTEPPTLYTGKDDGATVPVNPVMIGASIGIPGTAGLVPRPQLGDQSKALFGDGTFKTVARTTVLPRPPAVSDEGNLGDFWIDTTNPDAPALYGLIGVNPSNWRKLSAQLPFNTMIVGDGVATSFQVIHGQNIQGVPRVTFMDADGNATLINYRKVDNNQVDIIPNQVLTTGTTFQVSISA